MASDDVLPAESVVSRAPRAWRLAAVLPIYIATMFLSAMLLFWVQPLISKMALPLLGGSSAVWNTAMVFFQAVLLAGYAYAHLTSRWLSAPTQAMVHLVVLGLGFGALPVGLAVGWTLPEAGAPVAWLATLLAVSVGWPFFAMSANAPILQRWFSQTGHAAAGDPYFLYSASNFGSILALFAFPVLFEPVLRLADQGLAWSAGYATLTLLVGLSALALRQAGRRDGTTQGMTAKTAATSEPVPWRRRLHWIALSFVPSSMLLGLTAHITTDVAAAPFLWVMPLALYLLSFVAVFARRPVLRHRWMVAIQPFLLVPMALFFWAKFPVVAFLPFHLAAFFVTAMVCHGELVKRRPPADRLTEFYLWMSVGGVLGGAFTALLAPVIFDRVWEYPLVLALACLLRPALADSRRWARPLDVALPLALFAFLAAWFEFRPPNPDELDRAENLFLLVLPAALALYAFRGRPLRFGLGIAAALFAMVPANQSTRVLTSERSFFGVNKVTLSETGEFRLLIHGTTIHGAQAVDPLLRSDPLTYYYREGPAGQVMAYLGARTPPRRIGVIGLGAGSLACYRRPGEDWTFYEIDPVVVRLARETFHFLGDCAPDARIVLGDGRLSLERALGQRFDLLILDAFSSDSVPVHLMTREAMALYLDRLAPGGTIMIHISNRNLRLLPVISALVADAGLAGWYQRFAVPPEIEDRTKRFTAEWVVATRNPADLEGLVNDPRWRRLESTPGTAPWTDDFSNIIGVIRW